MPLLHNTSEQDLPWGDPAGELIPAGTSVEVSDEEAARVNTDSGVWVVVADAPKPAASEERSAVRRGGRRGSSVVEESAAPVMETR